MSNSFLTKKFLSVNNKNIYIYILIYHGSTNHNKLNTNNKLKIIENPLNKYVNILYDNIK